MNIDFANLAYQHELYKDEIEKAILKVARNCNFIMGTEISEFETELEKYIDVKYAISCSSGTDAILMALMAIDIKLGDEVITTPFTFVATSEMIALLGAKPVFVDIDEKTYNIDANKIEAVITSKTKAILPVSLYGQPADMDEISKIAKKHNLKVVVDGAQSFGATFNDVKDLALGDIATTSFFPAKPLGCYGDGGAVFTNDENLAVKLKSLRLHGQSKRYHHQYIGIGGRLDTIQAAVLLVKLRHYKKDLSLRQEVASKYIDALQDKNVILPYIDSRAQSAWAQYSIRIKNRDEVQLRLKEAGVPTAVHYPMPLHLQECFKYLGYKFGDFPVAEKISIEIMSLPMNPYLTENEMNYISEKFTNL